MSADQRTKRGVRGLAAIILAAQFTPENVRAWMLENPWSSRVFWPDYIESLITTLTGEKPMIVATPMSGYRIDITTDAQIPNDDSETCRLMTNEDGSRIRLEIYHPEAEYREALAQQLVRRVNDSPKIARRLAEVLRPFLAIEERANYVLGSVTTAQIDAAREVMEAWDREPQPA